MRKRVPQGCQASRIDKDGCTLSLSTVPRSRVIVDMDCDHLNLQSRRRCDYLLVCGEGSHVWVVPIDLKSGGFRASEVREQLQAGAEFAHVKLPTVGQFNFVPILAHGKTARRLELQKLREVRITLRGKRRQPKTLNCGDPAAKAFATS